MASLAKDRVIASILRARTELDSALEHIEYLPAFEAGKLGFVAHALSNYLTVMCGTTELLQEALRDHNNPEVTRWLEHLMHGSELMTHTVHQLMNSSTAGQEDFRPSEVNLPRLVERACAYYRRLAARKAIQLEFKNEATSHTIWADAVAVAAALDNLLSNAVKYTPRGRAVWVDIRGEPGWLVCRVRDEGPGIGPSERDLLFRRGVTLSALPTGGEPSTGFGLAVAKDLLQKIGGEIWHEVPEQGGACFAFRLPLAPTAVL